MKLLRSKKKQSKAELVKDYIAEIERYVVFAYLFCMLGIFPLYYKEQYLKIGNIKFEFFWNTSLCFIGVSLAFFAVKAILQAVMWKEEGIKFQTDGLVTKIKDHLSSLDLAVCIYTVCVLISYGFSDFKEFGFKGAAGWQMGLCSQLIFVALYFILSRQEDFISLILGVHLVVSASVFGIGILHRFEIDPLGMYTGLNMNQKLEFLSTIGQATWFSSYICTGFGIGMGIFYVSRKKWVRVLTGIYSVISFGILVTQNSDSAFIAIAGIMLLLGYFSLSGLEKWCRFLQTVCLMWGTFAGIGILQKIFSDRIIPLDTLSVFFSQSIVTWVLLILSLGILWFYTNKKNQSSNRIMKITKRVYQVILFLLAAGIIAMIAVIYLNTKGYLLSWFGYQSTNQYLFFNDRWGNLRGLSWSVGWNGFWEMSFLQKLFGVGPDCYEAYFYNIPEVYDRLFEKLNTTRLTNAHNEYLNSLICYGLVGLVSWIAVLTEGIRSFCRKAKENPFMIAFALCIAGYASHNIFCYQQVCCTPFLFIVLGIGESLTKSENFNTI